MSKRLSVTGKATFLLKTGARIWVEVFLTFCTVFSAEVKFIWEFLGAFPAACTKSSHTLVWKAAHSPAQSCHQHPLGTRASKVHEFGVFFPPFTSRKETWNIFPYYIFHWRQGSLMMQETDTKARLCSSLNFCISEEGKNRLLLSSSWFPLSSAAATDTVLMQGFTFIIWKAAREVKNMQMWPIKKRQEVLLQHFWWPSSTAEPHHHGNKQISSWSLSLKPDFLIYPWATQANNSGLHLIWWINPTFSLSLQEYCRFHLHSDVLKESSGKWKQPEKATPSLNIIVQD